ncbi:MAG: hypothetical protein FWH27_17815 [Planctomycetaceae bacterium]|nr:hypothetical protein [Planctomycetaceae bacterium]
MLEKIKTIFTTLKYAWNYSGTIASMLRHISAYPGVDDSVTLRTWLRPVIIDLSTLTSMTQNVIDDAVSRAAIRIIDSDRSWDAVYSLLMLAHDNTGIGGVKIPMDEMQTNAVKTFHEVADVMPVENPAVIIAAIGLIIQLIQLFKK